MSSNVSKFKFQVSSKPSELHSFYFQTSCLIKSATVVSSFPFWPNSGQYSTILIQRRTNSDPPFHSFVLYEPCIITQEAFVIQRCHGDCGEAFRAETIDKGMSRGDKRIKSKSRSNQSQSTQIKSKSQSNQSQSKYQFKLNKNPNLEKTVVRVSAVYAGFWLPQRSTTWEEF